MSNAAFNSSQPRGHVKNKGSWSAYQHSPSESVLPSNLTSSHDYANAIDEAYPQPQANSLEKVSCVADAVFAGANTHEAIAEALDVHDREGTYYGQAAGYLGLIEAIPGEAVATYGLTSLGQKFVIEDEAGRTRIMQSLIAQTPGVQIRDDGGEDALIDYLMETGLNETTAKRRSTTIASWSAAISDDDHFTETAIAELQSTHGRAVIAAERAVAARKLRMIPAGPVASFHSCGMQLSLSGQCDYC